MKKKYQKGAGIQEIEGIAEANVRTRVIAAQYSINVSSVKLLEYHQHRIVPIKQIIQIHFAQLQMLKRESETKGNFFTRSWNK